MNVFEEIRKEYQTRGLVREDLAADPVVQFTTWFDEAIKNSPGNWYEPNAMTLSTSAGGNVTSRTVLLKEFQSQRFVFFTNYDSEKGRQLEANPAAALLFHWHYLGRQVRIAGNVEKTTRQLSEEYFNSRPRGSRLAALASVQSRELASREELDRRYQELQQELADRPVPLPDGWGGYALRPQRFEFWQGRLNRLHDRFQYSRATSDATPGWEITRLYP